MALILDGEAIAHLFTAEDGPVAAGLLRTAIKVESEAKRLAPVATGRLRSSIAHVVGRNEDGETVAFVGTDVNYAIYQEMGTRFQSGTPFLRPALQSVRGKV